MSNNFKNSIILLGQIISSVTIILFIWVWGEAKSGKEFFAKYLIYPELWKIFLSLAVIVVNIFIIYKNLKNTSSLDSKDRHGKDQ